VFYPTGKTMYWLVFGVDNGESWPISIGTRAANVHTIGRTSIVSFDDFKNKVRSSMLSLQRNPAKIRSFYQLRSLKYAA
jgi:hypothetical protein